MTKLDNVKIFEDTKRICCENPSAVDLISKSVEKQKIYLESENVFCNNKKCKGTKVVVSGNRTFEAARKYAGKKVGVLNFASSTNPGGGVLTGSFAQEEGLCRCSSLYFCLTQDDAMEKFYWPHRNNFNPLHTDDIIYTPDVTVLKTDESEPKLLKETDWCNVDVITCAAPNLRNDISISDEEILSLHEKRGRKIMSVACKNDLDVLILGAFGCGAFQNNPYVVAKAYKNLLIEFENCFETIEFAIYNPPMRDSKNFDVFNQVLLG